ncbi:MAG: hypothetical protein WBX01_01770 [Nitrososphaeraceae archaeon]
MTKYWVYVNASIVAGIVVAIALAPTVLMTNSVLATMLGGSGGNKDQRCNGENHTINYCSGYYRGKGDCEDGNKYKGKDKHHTSAWRTGYKAGWKQMGCR